MSYYIETPETEIKRGELYAISGYCGKLYPGLYKGKGAGTYQFWLLTEQNVNQLKAGKDLPIEYMGGGNRDCRVVKIDREVLKPVYQTIYDEMKKLLG